MARLSESGHELCLVPQSIYEYWVVATRPLAVNGFGMPISDVDRRIQELLLHFTLLRDERGVYSRWYDLVVSRHVQGKQAHDARLVAAMERHNVKHLLTFNRADFARFPAIVVLSPDELQSGMTIPHR
jgi:predicted nucleic acid-binding protein